MFEHTLPSKVWIRKSIWKCTLTEIAGLNLLLKNGKPTKWECGTGALLPPEGTTWTTGDELNHSQYKAGARALPRLSHPTSVKRGAGGAFSQYVAVFSILGNSVVDRKIQQNNFKWFSKSYMTPFVSRSWAICSWTLLKLLTMLHKVKP